MNTHIWSVARALIIGLGVGAVTIVSGCGGSDGEGSPEELGKAAAKAITDKDLQKLKDLTCDGQAKSVSEENLNLAGKLPDSLKEATIVVEYAGIGEQSDDRAEIKFKIILEDLPPEVQRPDGASNLSTELYLDAVDEDGKWVMCEEL